ncbi:MAG: hypothetical protein V2A54_02855 [Bacteroidota bacterium]
MKFLTTIVFTLLLNSLSAQDSTYYRYNSFIKKATDYAKQDERKKALNCYDSAFMLIDFVFYDYYETFEIAIDDSDFPRANDYAINGTLKGLKLSHYNSPELTFYERSKYGIEFRRMKDSLSTVYLKSIDQSNYEAIEELNQLDMSRGAFESGQMKMDDSLIFDKLIALSYKKGFPTFQKTGIGCNTAQKILWHSFHDYPASDQWKRILPLINIEIFKGTLDPNYLKELEEMWERRNIKK